MKNTSRMNKMYPTYKIKVSGVEYKVVLAPSVLSSDKLQLYQEKGVETLDINNLTERDLIFNHLRVFGII